MFLDVMALIAILRTTTFLKHKECTKEAQCKADASQEANVKRNILTSFAVTLFFKKVAVS